jgi:hypothetical protein
MLHRTFGVVVVGFICTGCASANRVPLAVVAAHAPNRSVGDVSTLRPMVDFRPRDQTGPRPAPVYSNGCLTNPAALEPGKTYRVSGSRPTIPTGFSRIEKGEADNKYHVGAAVNLGLGYSWFHGSSLYSEPANDPAKGSLDINTDYYWGISVNTGGVNKGADLNAALAAAVFAGFRDFGLTAGYDLVTKTPFFGIAAKIDVFKIARGGGSDICVRGEAI